MKTILALFFGVALFGLSGGVLEAKETVSAADILTYRKGAEQGDALAQFNLGFCYDNGDGVAKDATLFPLSESHLAAPKLPTPKENS